MIITCPYCHKQHIVKMGFVKSNGSQRYKCKDCGKTFTETTNKIFSYSHKKQSVWRKYVDCFLMKFSLRDTARICKINIHTAFDWRHKILDTLQLMQDGVTLKGNVQADETFFRLSYKGCREMPRRTHKRGKSIHKRGLSTEQVCVVCSVDDNSHSIGKVAKLGKPSYRAIKAVLNNRISSNSTLIADSLTSYKRFAKVNKLNLIQIPTKRYTNGNYNIQKINSYHSELKRFIIGRFNGVATKYLNNYLVYHNFVNISKDKNKKRILRKFLLNTVSTTKGYQIVDRVDVPVLA